MFRTIFAFIGLLATSLAAAQPPIVIAHRGASGYLPEHTLEAYALAYGQGADYIEPDLVLTRDGIFICLHDIHLETTTDVEQKFPDRAREDGQWYAIDFTLEEIKTLNVHERIEGRFPLSRSSFEVPTFVEMIEMIQGMNAVTGRQVGIYPELKAPSFHRDEDLPMEEAVLSILSEYGYHDQYSPVYVQCFEPDTLKALRNDHGTRLKLVQLIGDDEQFAPLRTEEGIEAIAEYANGIGPYKGDIDANPDMVKWAHERDLEVHPYTLRSDDVAENFSSFSGELNRYLGDLRVDGLFTDQPDKVIEYLNR